MRLSKTTGGLALWLALSATAAWGAQDPATPGPAPEPLPPPAADDDGGGRIVGGTPADPFSTPWQVEIYSTLGFSAAEFAADAKLPKGDPDKHYLKERLGYEIAHRCGGALIAQNLVLTAAHCVANMPGTPDHPGNVLTDRRVQIGSQNLLRPGANFAINAVVIHKGYDRANHLNDIALIRLKADAGTVAPPPVAACPALKPGAAPPPIRACAITLHDKTNALRANEQLRATGWGITGAVDDVGQKTSYKLDREGNLEHNPSALMQVSLAYVTPPVCAQAAPYGGKLAPGMLCAGSAIPGRDTCQGDSGGPLTRYDPARGRVLAGLVSWGAGCAMKGVPGIYTRVSEYRGWIDAATAEAKGLKPGVWWK